MRRRERKSVYLGGKMALFATMCACVFMLSGCGGATYDDSAAEMSSEEIGFENYDEDKDVAMDDTAEVAEIETVDTEDNADADSADSKEEDIPSQQEQDKILVYTGAVSIDTMEFEDTVLAFKKAIEEYGGFLENEQSYGAGSKYAEESFYNASVPRTFQATARIPSEKYQEFMDKTQGLGVVTESNSQVTNMTRQYGTLKAELEIYEAEYERYLKMFDEVSEDSAMLAIQEKLTELSLDIARTKSEMAVIDTDSMYSTVEMRIQEVTAFEEKESGFFNRLVKVLSQSWQGMLRFFEAILFFFILHWYKLLLFFLVIFFIVKFIKRYQVKRERERQRVMQDYQARQQSSQRTQQQMKGKQFQGEQQMQGEQQQAQGEKSQEGQQMQGEKSQGEQQNALAEVERGEKPQEDGKE